MRRTATLCAAMAAFALTGAQAEAGFLFFGNSGSSCCNTAPKCCKPAPAPKCCKPAPAPKCCKPVRTCCNSGGGLFSGLKLPKLSLPSLGGNNCCRPAPACSQPAPPSCSGGHAPAAAPAAGGKVEDAPAPPPYEEKAPAPAPPAAPSKEAAPAPAAPKAEAKA